MDAFSLLLVGGSMAQGGVTLAQSFANAKSAELQGKYQKQQFDFQADLFDFQAGDSIRRGEKQAQEVRKGTAQVRGSQRAALAAQGLDPSAGSAGDVIDETNQMGAMDEMEVRNNAWRESWGFKVQAAASRGAGRMAEIGAQNEAAQTLVTGGMQAAGSFLKAAEYGRGGMSLGYQKQTAEYGRPVAGGAMPGRLQGKHPRMEY